MKKPSSFLFVLLFAAGCSHPFLPDDVVRIDPVPAEFALYYAELETCFGVRGNYGRVVFWEINRTVERNGDVLWGWADDHNIVLPMGWWQRDHWWAVHEIAHDVLDYSSWDRLDERHPLWDLCVNDFELKIEGEEE